MAGPWRPVLAGARREYALETVQAIARSLDTWTPTPLHGPAAGAESPAGGFFGLAVLHAYLAATRSGYDDEAAAARCLDQAMDAASAMPMGPALHGGFTGVAWVATHLLGRLAGSAADPDDPNQVFDDALLNHLAQSPWTGAHDLVGGLVGFGVYALERLPRPAAVACLARVIERLDETAERGDVGVTWFTPPEMLPPWQREQCPHGHHNLGLAHGVPGMIALLGCACAAGVSPASARALLDGAVAWLLAQQPADGEAGFASWVGPGITPVPARSAWCYGDPGIAAALLLAARCVGETAWEREALAIARRAGRRPPDQTGVVDAGLCHGAAGLGHIFNRMFQATGDPALGEAARLWLERALAMRQPGRGIAGFSTLVPGEDGSLRRHDDPGILTGAAGIALALLAAATPVEPAWDRMLLLSAPPRLGRAGS